MIDVKIKGMRKLQREFRNKPGKLKTAIRQAVNRTGVTARKDIVSAARSEIPVKAGELKRKNVKLQRARGGNLGARIRITGSRIPLIQFQARETQNGVTYNVGRGRQRIGDAFIRKMRSGHQGVFKRIGKSRLPITELHGPGVPHVLEKEYDKGRLKKKIAKTLEKNVKQQVTRAMSK